MTTTTATTNEKPEPTDESHDAERRTVASLSVHAPSHVAVVGVDESVNVFSTSAAFELAQRQAKALAAGTMVPEQYRNNIPNCLIALELSSRINVSVFAVMQNIDVIHGRPSFRAAFLIATVNACGRFSPLRFRWFGEEGKPTFGCRAVAKDIKSGEELVGTLITWAMVHAEGWSDKKGSKWKTMPEQMFQYRAAAFWARIYAPELSLGMHTVDEHEDIGPTVQVVQPRQASPPARRGINQFAATVGQQVDTTPSPEPEPAAMPDHDPETGETDPDPDDPLDEYT
jgi:hypothetical protein